MNTDGIYSRLQIFTAPVSFRLQKYRGQNTAGGWQVHQRGLRRAVEGTGISTEMMCPAASFLWTLSSSWNPKRAQESARGGERGKWEVALNQRNMWAKPYLSENFGFSAAHAKMWGGSPSDDPQYWSLPSWSLRGCTEAKFSDRVLLMFLQFKATSFPSPNGFVMKCQRIWWRTVTSTSRNAVFCTPHKCLWCRQRTLLSFISFQTLENTPVVFCAIIYVHVLSELRTFWLSLSLFNNIFQESFQKFQMNPKFISLRLCTATL